MRQSQGQVRPSPSNTRVGHRPAGQRPLTERQQRVVDFIGSFHAEHGYAPTIRQIAEQFGFRSPNGVICHLRALQKRGVICWVPNACRTLQIISQASAN